MLNAPDKRHSKYSHVYAVVRFDFRASIENCATVVKVLRSRDAAEEEAARLRQVNKGKECSYIIQTTRFVEDGSGPKEVSSGGQESERAPAKPRRGRM